MKNTETFLSVRVVHVETGMTYSNNKFSPITGKKVPYLPEMKIFGHTPRGQNILVHLHDALPYFFVPLPSSMTEREFTKIATKAIEEFIQAEKKISPDTSIVYDVKYELRTCFYGYYKAPHPFAKIILLNQSHLSHAAQAVQSGIKHLYGITLQPFEIHISYALKVFREFKICGMQYMHLRQGSFRLPLPDQCTNETNPGHSSWKSHFQSNPDLYEEFFFPAYTSSVSYLPFNNKKKESSCELEADASVFDIIQLEATGGPVKLVKQLKHFWTEEQERFEKMKLPFPHLSGRLFEEDGVRTQDHSGIAPVVREGITEKFEMLRRTLYEDEQVNSFRRVEQVPYVKSSSMLMESATVTSATSKEKLDNEYASGGEDASSESGEEIIEPESASSGPKSSTSKNTAPPEDSEHVAEPDEVGDVGQENNSTEPEGLKRLLYNLATNDQLFFSNPMDIPWSHRIKVMRKKIKERREKLLFSWKPRGVIPRKTTTLSEVRGEERSFMFYKPPPSFLEALENYNDSKLTEKYLSKEPEPTDSSPEKDEKKRYGVISPLKLKKRKLCTPGSMSSSLCVDDSSCEMPPPLRVSPPQLENLGPSQRRLSLHTPISRGGTCHTQFFEPKKSLVLSYTSPRKTWLKSGDISQYEYNTPSFNKIMALDVLCETHRNEEYLDDFSIPSDPVLLVVLWLRNETYDIIYGSNYSTHYFKNDRCIILSRLPYFPKDGICFPMDDYTDVYNFPTEEEIFTKFEEIMTQYDPTLILTWNRSSSINILISRGKYLKRESFVENLCRSTQRAAFSTSTVQQRPNTNAFNSFFQMQKQQMQQSANEGVQGKGLGKTFNSNDRNLIQGRIVLEVEHLSKEQMRLRTSALHEVILNVFQTTFPQYSNLLLCYLLREQKSSAEKAIHYLSQKSYYTIRITDRLEILTKLSTQCKFFGSDILSIVHRGSQYNVESILSRIAFDEKYVMPTPSRFQVKHQAAPEVISLVLEPESNFYTDPVLVMDYQSLYPSIIIAYNICYTTCIGRLDKLLQYIETNKHDDIYIPLGTQKYHITRATLREILQTGESGNYLLAPNNVIYVSKEVREGIFPRILMEILQTRVMIKRLMKMYSSMSDNPIIKQNPTLLARLNGRQLSLKLFANVSYGYMGASFSGRNPIVEGADSIVMYGRRTLERSFEIIESSSRWGARVVYGDTDSIFILLQGRTVPVANEIGKEIVSNINLYVPSPMELMFEKTYYGSVLQTKKRYCGLILRQINDRKKEFIFDGKGIETVRRDVPIITSRTMERCLKIIFLYRDLSLVKKYLLKEITGMYKKTHFNTKELIVYCKFAAGSYAGELIKNKVLPAAANVAYSQLYERLQLLIRNNRLDPSVLYYLQYGGVPGESVADKRGGNENGFQAESAAQLMEKGPMPISMSKYTFTESYFWRLLNVSMLHGFNITTRKMLVLYSTDDSVIHKKHKSNSTNVILANYAKAMHEIMFAYRKNSLEGYLDAAKKGMSSVQSLFARESKWRMNKEREQSLGGSNEKPSYDLNMQYYVEKQILPPLQRMMNMTPFDDLIIAEWFKGASGKSKKHTVSSYFSSVGCVHCGEKLGLKEGPFCHKCSHHGKQVVSLESRKLNKKIRRHQRLLQECIQCSGSMEMAVSCYKAYHCPTYFYKIQEEIAIEALHANVSIAKRSFHLRDGSRSHSKEIIDIEELL